MTCKCCVEYTITNIIWRFHVKHVQPRGTYIVVRPDKVAKISEVIVTIEDTDAVPPARGLVLAVGPLTTEVNEGDIVHFERFDWCVAPEDCIILREEEILARE